MLRIILILSLAIISSHAALPLVSDVPIQPLSAQVNRLLEALDFLGAPLAANDKESLLAALAKPSEKTSSAVQTILDKYCLLGINVNPESRVKLESGEIKRELLAGGWRSFLVKIHNEAGVTATLVAVSPNAKSSFEGGWFNSASDKYFRKTEGKGYIAGSDPDLWLDLELFEGQLMPKELSGLALEYRILQLYSRDAGQREARILFNVGQGTQDIGFRNEANLLFKSVPPVEVTLGVRDEHDQPTTASFVIKDRQGHVYPSQAKRLAPDFSFHPQVYRRNGESIHLPTGQYTVEFSRGPESILQKRTIQVDASHRRFDFKVERWIDPAATGWWSGDHHIHAAGCAHYTKPTEGVHAPDMLRHCQGEDLKIGANLTWGPCFDYQKQFFSGAIDKVSEYPYLLRYDIEVSGFGSHESGHLCLLRLRNQMYPGGESKHHWPTLGLSTLRWAKAQGALVGPAHTGWGLGAGTSDLPNYVIPPFDGIGANEYIVDVTHQLPGPGGKMVPAVDFLSTVDTPYPWELNIWYHTLNAGFRTRISGETDFPCIYGERVGMGRSYVKLSGKLDYEDWCEGIRAGHNYVSDGRSHLFDFKINDAVMGEKNSELKLSAAGGVKISVRAAARLEVEPNPAIQKRSPEQKPYWDIERARIGSSREVPVEVIVNGYPVATLNLLADGQTRDLHFTIPIAQSSWVALRVLASSHTNPIFIKIGDKPIRASKRSVDWCLKGVDRCWSQKERFIRADEMQNAKDAYDHARNVYRQILAETETP